MSNRTYLQSTASSVVGDKNAILHYEQAHNVTLKAISLVEWHFTHDDFKGVTCGINPDLPAGIPTIMDYDQGTCLVLVKVVRDDEAVTAKVAKLQQQIQTLEAGITWGQQHPERTLKEYVSAIREKITELQGQIAQVEKMGEAMNRH